MAEMIDWLTVTMPISDCPEVNGGMVVSFRPDGATEWRKEKRLPVTGSWDSKVYVIAYPGRGLWISGNPAKFLQGHNLFGSADLIGLAVAMSRRVCDELGIDVSGESDLWLEGCFKVSRSDITRMFALESREHVRRWLVAVGQIAHGRHQLASLYKGETVYMGQHSRRSSLKAYGKGDEMMVHPMLYCGEKLADLMLWADNKVRVELTLRSMALKDRGLDAGTAWKDSSIPGALFDEYVSKLEISDTMVVADEVADRLPPRLLAIYDSWRAGRDLRSTLSRAAFYRWRKQLLPYGVDIAHVRPRIVQAEMQYLLGAPLKSFITGPGEDPPAWAHGTELLACS